MATSAKLDTLVPTGAPPPVTDARVGALVALAKALGGGPLLSGFVGGVIAVAGHSMLDSERIVQRVETIEAALILSADRSARTESFVEWLVTCKLFEQQGLACGPLPLSLTTK